MQRNVLAGSEFLLYNIENKPVAYSKNCAIKLNQNLTDVTTKDSDSWTELMVGIKDWSIEFEGLVSYGDGFNTTYFIDRYESNEPFFIKFGVVQDDFTHAFVGEVYIESLTQTADDGEVVSYSGSLKGIGHLLFNDAGTPIQSGYLKVETDPVFRGSPAFNISDVDKLNWNEADNKVVKELNFKTVDDVTTLKLKFKDGVEYSASFRAPVPIIDLSGYYKKNEADQKIAVAQVAADAANTLLYNIAADSKLTPNEKINVLKEWQIIQDEMPKLLTQAVSYLIDTVDYDVAYIQLGQYVNPLLLSMITTDDIVGYELRDSFRRYYDQKVDLLKRINDSAIDTIKIGNRNYQLNGDKVIVVSQPVNQIIQNGNYPINSDLAISFYAKSTDGSNQLYLQFDGSDSKAFNISNYWMRYTALLKSTEKPILYGRVDGSIAMLNINAFSVSNGFPYSFPASFNSAPTVGIELKDIIVVQGNKPVDFTPAPEDYYNRIIAKANEIIANTTVEINVANTATLQAAKDDAGNKATIARNAAISSANNYTTAQRLLAEVTAAAYADDIVTEEEQARITQARNNLQAAKDDATNKSNAAAEYGIAAQNLHNALINNLKSLAYQDVVEVSKLGNTVVQGGMIKANLLDVNYIKTGIINTTYLESLDIISKSIRTAATGQRVEILADNNIKFYTSGSSVPMITIDDKLIIEDSSITPNIKGAGIAIGDFNDQTLGYTQIGRKRSSFTGDLSVDGLTNLYRFSHNGAKNSNYKVLANGEDYVITINSYVIVAADNCKITWPLVQSSDGREIKISTCYTTTNTTLSSIKYIHGVDALDGTSLILPPNKVFNYLVTGNVIVSI